MSITEKDLFQLFEEQKAKMEELEAENLELKKGATVIHQPVIEIGNIGRPALFPTIRGNMDKYYMLHAEGLEPFSQDEIFEDFFEKLHFKFEELQKDYKRVQKMRHDFKNEAKQRTEDTIKINSLNNTIAGMYTWKQLLVVMTFTSAITFLLSGIFS